MSMPLHDDFSDYPSNQAIRWPDAEECADAAPPAVLLYDDVELLELAEASRSAKDQDAEAHIRNVVRKMKLRGPHRTLTVMPENFRDGLIHLRATFPNFVEVIDYLRNHAEIAWRTDKVMRFTPILLNGPGGVGKTMFCEAVGRWLNHGFHRISISSSQNGAELAGTSAFFSNAKPGVPFHSLVFSETANHLFFLDEIEKNSTSDYDVHGALYVLLEPSTARTFKDQAIPLQIDASHLLYMAASNDANRLPEPLRSRFRQFEIGITPLQASTIARAIVSDKLEALRPASNGLVVSEAAIHALSAMTPRRIGQALTEAIGKALAEGADVIEDIVDAVPKRGRMGF
jgi:ATP-dependent Lon protease